MPHQCVRCGKMHEDGSSKVLSGCSCGSRFFFYVKEEDLKQLEKETAKLTPEEKKEIEEDVISIVGEGMDKSMPVVFNFESIRIKKPGKFEIDLVNLFKGEPLIYKIEEGKYIIDLPSTFQMKKD